VPDKTPTCILSSDWHIRGDRPICRTDDYMEAQKKKITYVLNLSNEYNCPILVAGDFGHKPMWGDKLLNWFMDINFCYSPIITVCGQHDLPNHRLDKWEEAGVGVLNKSMNNFEVINKPTRIEGAVIFPFHYSDTITQKPKEKALSKIALVHKMVIKSQKEKLWHDQEAHSAKWYLEKYPCYDLIVTGDNHQSFSVEYEGRWLVNCGSLTRMSANQIDHKPSVFLWYAEDNTVDRVYLPIGKDVISREHIEVKGQRDKRVESFVSRLKNHQEIGFNFEENLKEFLHKNNTGKLTKTKIWESLT